METEVRRLPPPPSPSKDVKYKVTLLTSFEKPLVPPRLRRASRRTLRYPSPRVSERIKPYQPVRPVNSIRKVADHIHLLPRVERSPDATDDFLLALSEGGKANFLVTGDKSGLLALGRHKATRIIPVNHFAALFC